MQPSWAKVYQTICGSRLQQGPFQGMDYITACIGSALWPKILGTYEIEPAPCIEALVDYNPDAIVNVGAAEGYYSVGLALKCPEARVIAFEMEEEGRKLMHLLAKRNNVRNRIQIEAGCGSGDLEPTLQKASRPAIVIDAEGAELELLNPATCPSLRRSAILMESHVRAGVETGAIMGALFQETHTVLRVRSQPRTFQQLPRVLRLLGHCGMRRHAMSTLEEGRGGPMTWLWLTPR